MNLEFDLALTPATARRLVRLASIAEVEIDPAIAARANDDRIDFNALDLPVGLTEWERNAVQFALDCALRLAIPSERAQPAWDVALTAARISGVRPILVASPQTVKWTQHALRFGLSVSSHAGDEPDILLRKIDKMIDQNLLYDRRGGLLIIDWKQVEEIRATGLAREFERCIIVGNPTPTDDRTDLKDSPYSGVLGEMVKTLYPEIDTSPLTEAAFGRARHLGSRGFRKTHPWHIGFLFNVETRFLPEPTGNEDFPITSLGPLFDS